jgi:hypothetical protein
MSTRSTTWFIDGNAKKPEAIVYRHSDGYPEGAGVDILRFLDECGKLKDPRFSDSTYLAAKYVVFLADLFNDEYVCDKKTGNGTWKRADSKLAFLSVGVMRQDPCDIEYRYVIDCRNFTNGRPTVKCYAVSGKYVELNGKYKDIPQSEWTLTETPIPVESKASV